MVVRMWLHVPFRMPLTAWSRLADAPSRMALITGTPPATAASYLNGAPAASAAFASARPWVATIALLAVTTARPAASAERVRASAGPSAPPDHLHHHPRVGGEFGRVVAPGEAVQGHAPVARAVAGGHGDHADRPAGAAVHQLAILRQQAQHARAHRAQARQADGQRVPHRPRLSQPMQR